MSRDEDQDWARGPRRRQEIDDPKVFEIADYPPHWTSEQRVGCYWFALRNCGLPPTTTSAWEAVEAQRQRHISRRTDARKQEGTWAR